MGLITSRLNLEGLPSSRRRSQQEETTYTYSLNKSYFSNYFFMGGERFEVNDPDYLFGDNCDLNFLSCTKPHVLPYKKAQQNLLNNLCTKQKANNKASSRVNRLSPPFNLLTGRHRQVSQSRKQDAQTQTLHNTGNLSNSVEPSRPLVMLINIRKETLRLVRSSLVNNLDSDVTSVSSSTSSDSARSVYTSVKDIPPSEYNASDNDDFEDALNDTTNLSSKEDDDNESEGTQQKKSLLHDDRDSGQVRDVKITIEPLNSDHSSELAQTTVRYEHNCDTGIGCNQIEMQSRRQTTERKNSVENQTPSSRVYNLEFNFDCEVDCSIQIFYFCTREINSNGVKYIPQHATYKSRAYTYKKGLNQKFEQQEHTFQPHLFDEDLLIYKPLDMDGNYNSGAVFPIVINCSALDGSCPQQSNSLVATVEKSQLDDSYSIKPLKQLIFVDGIQYILQDIYGIENKRLQSRNIAKTSSKLNRSLNTGRNLRASSASLQSTHCSQVNQSETASLSSIDTSFGQVQNSNSLTSNQFKSIGSENTFECVICMSEERDTMLLPCRHLCLCSSCAQSLRYQANSCPICRCPFKAALNLRIIRRNLRSRVASDHRNTERQSTTTTTT